ncbi:MAG TPA: spore coat protein [Symbiobacteriaceae bacterium]|jgi:similar to spore coat protein|nr:spore coat protein [Symbiobacteriaceae bacterium]
MNNDFLDPRNAEGMPKLADASFALDFLMNAKMGVRNTAFALAETASPRVRTLLRRQLSEALALHQEISELMLQKGWLRTYDLAEQFDLDMVSADTVLKIAGMQLFPEDTARQGLFATPNK